MAWEVTPTGQRRIWNGQDIALAFHAQPEDPQSVLDAAAWSLVFYMVRGHGSSDAYKAACEAGKSLQAAPDQPAQFKRAANLLLDTPGSVVDRARTLGWIQKCVNGDP
jgi:hypothetical protein